LSSKSRLVENAVWFVLGISEKNPDFPGFLNIDENAHQFISIYLPGMLPLALDSLSFGGDCPKLGAKFDKSVADEIVGYGLAVVKPEWE
jgi:hypothetical protein